MAKKNVNYIHNNVILQPEDSRRVADSTEAANEKIAKDTGLFLVATAAGLVGWLWKDEICENVVPVVKEYGGKMVSGVKKFGRKIIRKNDPVFGDVETLTEEE